MFRKALAVFAAAAAIVTANSVPAHAACPAAGCLLDVQTQTRYLDFNTSVTIWMRIDYTNHRIRPYAKFSAANGHSIKYLGTSWNPAYISLWRGTSRVINTSGERIAQWTSTVTVPGDLYSCPTSAGAYYASWTGTVSSTSGDYEVYDFRSGTSQTYCGW